LFPVVDPNFAESALAVPQEHWFIVGHLYIMLICAI
jgi:hypothetical protein